jgi:recombination protein RecA
VRIDVRRSAQLKQGDNVVGNLVKAKIVKNKVAPPFQTTEFNILYNQGIDLMGDVLETGVKYDVVSKAGASYSFGETKLGVGRDAATTFLRENPKIVKEIKKAVWDAAKAAVVATPITQSE